jgi:hypothetical protein
MPVTVFQSPVVSQADEPDDQLAVYDETQSDGADLAGVGVAEPWSAPASPGCGADVVGVAADAVGAAAAVGSRSAGREPLSRAVTRTPATWITATTIAVTAAMHALAIAEPYIARSVVDNRAHHARTARMSRHLPKLVGAHHGKRDH